MRPVASSSSSSHRHRSPRSFTPSHQMCIFAGACITPCQSGDEILSLTSCSCCPLFVAGVTQGRGKRGLGVGKRRHDDRQSDPLPGAGAAAIHRVLVPSPGSQHDRHVFPQQRVVLHADSARDPGRKGGHPESGECVQHLHHHPLEPTGQGASERRVPGIPDQVLADGEDGGRGPSLTAGS